MPDKRRTYYLSLLPITYLYKLLLALSLCFNRVPISAERLANSLEPANTDIHISQLSEHVFIGRITSLASDPTPTTTYTPWEKLDPTSATWSPDGDPNKHHRSDPHRDRDREHRREVDHLRHPWGARRMAEEIPG